MTRQVAYVAFGSNVGDRMVRLRQAAERLAGHPGVRVAAVSAVLENPALGPSQSEFLNAVAKIETTLSPEALLVLCRNVERAGRRQRSVHWGPRTIDLDIVDFGGIVRDDPHLRLPHPEVRNRIFVMKALADVAPEWAHPTTNEPISALLERMRNDETLIAVAGAQAWRPYGANAKDAV